MKTETHKQTAAKQLAPGIIPAVASKAPAGVGMQGGSTNSPAETPNPMALDPRGKPIANRRRSERWPFTHKSIPVAFKHPGGTSVRTMVSTQDISAGGIGLVHTSYIHPGTTCRVAVPKFEGGHEVLDGTVVRCIHRGGVVHAVGVLFAEVIRPERFVGDVAPLVPNMPPEPVAPVAGAVAPTPGPGVAAAAPIPAPQPPLPQKK